MEHETARHGEIPVVDETEMDALRRDMATFLHSSARMAARDHFDERRYATLTLLELFIARLKRQSRVTVDSRTVDRVAGVDAAEHPMAALRKSQ